MWALGRGKVDLLALGRNDVTCDGAATSLADQPLTEGLGDSLRDGDFLTFDERYGDLLFQFHVRVVLPSTSPTPHWRRGLTGLGPSLLNGAAVLTPSRRLFRLAKEPALGWLRLLPWPALHRLGWSSHPLISPAHRLDGEQAEGNEQQGLDHLPSGGVMSVSTVLVHSRVSF